MDNFSPRSNKRLANSVDGFVVGKRHGKQGAVGDLRDFNRYYRPNTGTNQVSPHGRPHVDGFPRAVDGFVPSMPAPIQNPAATTRSTVFDSPHKSGDKHIGEDIRSRRRQGHETEKKRRRLFGRKKHDQAKRGKTSKLKRTLQVSGVFVSLAVLVAAGTLLRSYLLSRNIFKGGGSSALLNNQNVDPSQLKGEGDGRINILMLGKGGEEQSDGPDLTDTIIVASIDPLAKEAALLSVPRDFWVKSPGGGQVKINQIYHDAKAAALNKLPYKERNSDNAKSTAESAGTDAIKHIVSETMGVPIHYYVMIDFAGFRRAIDTVGGVDINVSEDMAVSEWMRIAGRSYKLDVDTGWQHFDGMRALAFSRSRKTSARGDFARADRQRAVIVALKEKVLTVGTLANPVKLNQLLSDFSGQLSTDFSVNELLRLYDLAKEIPADKVASVGLDEHVVGDMINGTSVQVPKAGLFDYSEIQNYVRNIMRDAFLKREDAKIIILNGTDTAGLATKKSNELKSFGYNVISIGDAPTKSYTSTVLVNLRGSDKRYTLNYLEKRLGVKATSSLPDSSIAAGEADFVLILGADTQ